MIGRLVVEILRLQNHYGTTDGQTDRGLARQTTWLFNEVCSWPRLAWTNFNFLTAYWRLLRIFEKSSYKKIPRLITQTYYYFPFPYMKYILSKLNTCVFLTYKVPNMMNMMEADTLCLLKSLTLPKIHPLKYIIISFSRHKIHTLNKLNTYKFLFYKGLKHIFQVMNRMLADLKCYTSKSHSWWPSWKLYKQWPWVGRSLFLHRIRLWHAIYCWEYIFTKILLSNNHI